MSATIVSKPIEDYVMLFSDPEDEVLHSLSLATQALVPGAQMLCGNLVGSFLRMMSQLLQARLIVELGTYTGYSAICLAQGLPADGKLITIDTDNRWEALRQEYWQKAGVQDKIEQRIGQGLEVFEAIEATPDLVFIDADKKNYWNYFQMALSKMKKGGMIIADNVLFHGEVVLPEDQLKGAAFHIHQFNIKTQNETRVEKIVLPIRDGISIFRIK